MKKWHIGVSRFLVVLMFAVPFEARCDMFGGDVAVLVQILANALEQLVQLKKILDTGKDNLDLIQEINRGINDSLQLLQTAGLKIDPGIYKDWRTVSDGLRQLQSLYGIAVPSPEQPVQNATDENVAEAIQFNNTIYDYANDVDRIGEAIKQYSHQVSPGGAQKLTAESMGVMLHVMNQSLRAQATGLKLQAQTLALANKKDKDYTRDLLEKSQTLESSMRNDKAQFEIPRFD